MIVLLCGINFNLIIDCVKLKHDKNFSVVIVSKTTCTMNDENLWKKVNRTLWKKKSKPYIMI